VIQTKLDAFINPKPKCEYCGRIFKSLGAYKSHLRKAHPDKPLNPPTVYANEGIEVQPLGWHTIAKIKMRSNLWKTLEQKAKEDNITIDELIFQTLINLAGLGKEYKQTIDIATKQPPYII